MPDPIDEIRLLSLYKRLLDGDRLASAEISELLLGKMTRDVARKFPRIDTEIICDGVTDAILEFCAKPHRFNDSLGIPLYRFIAMAAWRNVANLVRSDARRRAREQKSLELFGHPQDVELRRYAGNVIEEEQLTGQRMERVNHLLTEPVDKKILQLRLKGERRTEEFARVMQITHLSVAEQRREVKRAKDRIDKFLQRNSGVHDETTK